MPPELPPEEPAEDGKEDDEREDGIIGVTPNAQRFIDAYDTLRRLDPDSPLLNNKFPDTELSSGAAADALETAVGNAARQRAIDFLMPNGKPLGQEGDGKSIREMPGGVESAQAAFDYLTVGAKDITPRGHIGKLMELPGNVGIIGFRSISRSE